MQTSNLGVEDTIENPREAKIATIQIPAFQIVQIAEPREEETEGWCSSILHFLVGCFCCASSTPIEPEKEALEELKILVESFNDNVLKRPYMLADMLPEQFNLMPRRERLKVIMVECNERSLEIIYPCNY